MTSVLADENVPRAAVEVLRNAGMDVRSVSETMAGAEDPAVLDLAGRKGDFCSPLTETMAS